MAFDYSGTSQTHSRTDMPVSAYPFTVSLWFYPDLTGAGAEIIWNMRDGVGLDAIAMDISAGADTLRAFLTTDGGATSAAAVSTGSHTQSAWNHCLVYFASSTSRGISLNGSTFDTDTATYALPAGLTSEEIGGFLTVNSEFNGRVCEIGIWDVALTQAESDMLALGLSPSFVRPQSLVSCRHMIRDTKDLVRGNTMTANGAPTVIEQCRVIYQGSNILQFPPVAAVASGSSALMTLGVG